MCQKDTGRAGPKSWDCAGISPGLWWLELTERVFARGWGKRDWVEHDPDYDILRDDPRFKKLLARLK